ncbi:glycosyltransferase family 39 protein, partial [Oceanispirochaeta sp.]|uniref:ArnT family glycosyltransferase n=1 Tax=Oceanispirochaeta sp. TaxID=2035350 RepID=UPI00261FDE97
TSSGRIFFIWRILEIQKIKKMTPQFLLIYLLIWFILNLYFLTAFPFAHSDEPWLSGLTRNMMTEGRPDVTETFFDLYPRHPHALKIIFHAFQMPFIFLGAYSLFSVRLLSLCAGVLCLYGFSRLLQRLSPGNKLAALTATILLSIDIQFIYAAHTARQEILLLLVLILAFYHYLGIKKTQQALFSGLIIGLSFGIHPNAFILAVPLGLLYLLDIFNRKKTITMGLFYLMGLAAGGVFFAGLSLLFNPGFISDYLAYGSPLGVTRSLDTKIRQLPHFLSQLYHRIGGTYYLPDIRPQMIFFLLFLLLLIPTKVRGRSLVYAGTTGVLMGIMALGKYSPLSILFLTPFLYLAFFLLIQRLHLTLALSVTAVFVALNLLLSASNIRTEVYPADQKESYKEYLEGIEDALPPGAVVLANMNTEYAFEGGHLFDYRNLSYLPDNRDSSVENYIRERKIEYILFPDELDFVYESRPVWNVLYGNPSRWYPELKNFIQKKSVLIETLDSPAYAMRIQAYKYKKEWKLKIYRVLPDSAREE